MLKLIMSATALFLIIYLLKEFFSKVFFRNNLSQEYTSGKRAEGKKYQYGQYVRVKATMSTCILCDDMFPPNININKYEGISVIITVSQTENAPHRYMHGIKIYANRKGKQYLKEVSSYIFSLYY